MSDFLNGLVEVKNKANRVSDSAIARRKRILDAKRRMAVKRNGTASSINRVSDSARPSTRGMVAKRTVQGLTRKQDSASKSYMRLRQRIKDELAETETTEEAIEAAVNVLSEEVENAPAEVLNAAEDIISAVVEVVGDLLPDGGEGGEPEGEPEPEEEEVADSARRRNVVRRKGVADARKLAMIRRRVKDGLAKRRALVTRRAAVKDNAVRPSARPSVRRSVAHRSSVSDSVARARAIAAARRVRDARVRRAAAARPSRRAADSRMQRNVRRRG